MNQKTDNVSRKTISLPPELWKQVEDFRFDQRIGTEVDALRQLIQAGLSLHKNMK